MDKPRALRTLQVAVKRGHDLLMEHDPEYFLKVDLEKFLITCGCRCVVGQVFNVAPMSGEYSCSLRKLGVKAGQGWKIGFEGKLTLSPSHYRAETFVLQKLWARRIRYFQKQHAARKGAEHARA